ncbi:hypothetical protein QQ045_022482 [Rhodiola kirilowii]
MTRIGVEECVAMVAEDQHWFSADFVCSKTDFDDESCEREGSRNSGFLNDEDSISRVTKKGSTREKHQSIVGNPEYLAPEIQWDMVQRADWWSVGVILVELLVGIPPFNAGHPQELLGLLLESRIEMDWNYPDISLEDVSKLVKGFLDILILASGYQSSGRPAYWDVQSMKRALQWSLFFEKLIRNMGSKDEYADSLTLLEAELSLLKLDPHFPRGLVHLSTETLLRAKELVVTHIVQTLPLRREHLLDLLKAVAEIDLDELQASEMDCLDTYLGELMLQSASYKCAADEKRFIKDAVTSSPEIVSDIQFKNCCIMDNLAACTIEEILQRQNAVSFMTTAEIGLEALSTIVQRRALVDAASLSAQSKHGSSSLRDDQEVEFSTWDNWRSKNMSYFLDKRTSRIVSGASMIFSVPKCQWVEVFDTLHISKDVNVLHETIELLLLGCIADRWSSLLNNFISLPYVSCAISKQYFEVRSLLSGPVQISNAMDQNTKEYGIIEYLAKLVGSKLHLLCNASPALIAAAIPIWSPLFRSYVSEIEFQFEQEISPRRFCSCPADMAHTSCELAERIWCLHLFHVRGSFHIDEPGSFRK